MTREGLPSGLLDAYERQMCLCDRLEEVADSLPTRLNRQQCLHLARTIGPLIQQAHAAEESMLFPYVAQHHEAGGGLVEQLRLEHVEDECFAEEVQHELMQMGQGRPRLAPEATGYMLRGFFEGIRRHIRRERELMAEMARERRPSH